jgi:hypothetical protein
MKKSIINDIYQMIAVDFLFITLLFKMMTLYMNDTTHEVLSREELVGSDDDAIYIAFDFLSINNNTIMVSHRNSRSSYLINYEREGTHIRINSSIISEPFRDMLRLYFTYYLDDETILTLS